MKAMDSRLKKWEDMLDRGATRGEIVDALKRNGMQMSLASDDSSSHPQTSEADDVPPLEARDGVEIEQRPTRRQAEVKLCWSCGGESRLRSRIPRGARAGTFSRIDTWS